MDEVGKILEVTSHQTIEGLVVQGYEIMKSAVQNCESILEDTKIGFGNSIPTPLTTAMI